MDQLEIEEEVPTKDKFKVTKLHAKEISLNKIIVLICSYGLQVSLLQETD